MSNKLSPASCHLLRLIRKDADSDGWAKVSSVVWPLVQKLPEELVELRPSGDAGHVKLTEAGNTVLDWT